MKIIQAASEEGRRIKKKKSFNSKIELDNLLISTTRFLKDEIVDLSFLLFSFFFFFFILG